MSKPFITLSLLLLFNLLSSFCWPQEHSIKGVMTYVYPNKISKNDHRRSEVITLMRLALDKTEQEYGPYILEVSKNLTTEQRTIERLINSDEITVAWLDTTQALENKLLPVLIPIQKGIVGYRLLLIHHDNIEKFENINSIKQLQQYKNGLSDGWVNKGIMLENNLPFETGQNYEGLFKMLAVKRFDYFSRGVIEIFQEIEQRKQSLPSLFIEQNIALYYDKPSYLFVSKQKPRYAERMYKGLMALIEDGTFDKIFCQVNGEAIKKSRLSERHIIKLKSQLLLTSAPKGEKFWFNPNNNVCQND